MRHTQTQFETANASRYLQQLCKHFGHKCPVEFTPTEGHIELPFGRCELQADAHRLEIKGAAEDGLLDRFEQVVGDHFARFAFRENPNLSWTRIP